MTNGCINQNQRIKLLMGAQTPEKCHMPSSKVISLGWPQLTSEMSQFSVDHECHLTIPIHAHIISKNTKIRKFQALKRYGKQIPLDMTLDIRPKAKGHSRYGLEIFREAIKLVNG